MHTHHREKLDRIHVLVLSKISNPIEKLFRLVNISSTQFMEISCFVNKLRFMNVKEVFTYRKIP